MVFPGGCRPKTQFPALPVEHTKKNDLFPVGRGRIGCATSHLSYDTFIHTLIMKRALLETNLCPNTFPFQGRLYIIELDSTAIL